MLVLTRKKSEMIRIGNEVVITVLRTGNGTVKLGIDAPAHVRVLRAELCDNHDKQTAKTAERSDEEDEACPGSADRRFRMGDSIPFDAGDESDFYLGDSGHLPAIAVLAADA